MSLRGSMYRIVFCLIFFPFLLFSLIITQIYFDRLEKVITESLQVVADAQIEEMVHFCEQQNEYLTQLGTTDIARSAIQGELDDEISQYLDNMLYSQVEAVDYIRSLTIVDNTYRVVACSEEHEPVAAEGIEILTAGIGENSFYISNVLNDTDQEKTLVAIAKLEDKGQLLGYALAEISLDFYQQIRERAELWNDSTFYLLDGEQQIISAGTPDEDRDAFVTKDEDREDYRKKYSTIDFQKNPKGNFQYEIGGKDYITYYSNVAYTDWRVMLSVNMDNYQIQRTVNIILACFIILLCVVFAIWIGSFASRRIIHPIEQISTTLKAVQEIPDYSLQITVNRKDELGNLAEEINGLITYIQTENLYQKQQQRLLQEKAEQDALTKVLNKEKISYDLEEAIKRHRNNADKMAVLFVDIDDFKYFNTKYGHNVGDQVLLFITSVLTKGTLGTVGRVGGDEFLVIIESGECVQNLDVRLTQVKEVAESRFIVRGSGTHLPVYCSIGAIRIDFNRPEAKSLTPMQLTNMADAAMYEAKNNGKQGHVIKDV